MVCKGKPRAGAISEEKDKQVIVKCAGCGVPILTWWASNNRGLLKGEYLLAGDCVFHPKCWEDITNETNL